MLLSSRLYYDFSRRSWQNRITAGNRTPFDTEGIPACPLAFNIHFGQVSPINNVDVRDDCTKRGQAFSAADLE